MDGTLSEILPFQFQQILKETESLKVWKADARGVIKQSSPDDALKCDASTELEILNAMKRRGVAYELAKVMSFEKHEKIANLFFQELQREAPVGFKKVSMEQVASADREIHLKLAEKTRAGLPLGPLGELPLDLHLDDVLALPSVMWLLMPKPRTAAEKTVSRRSKNPVRMKTRMTIPRRRKQRRRNSMTKGSARCQCQPSCVEARRWMVMAKLFALVTTWELLTRSSVRKVGMCAAMRVALTQATPFLTMGKPND